MSEGNKRVLVIDDDSDLRELIQALLQNEGFDVLSAADGREAFELQKTRPADVVVTDIFMPDKDGIETIFEMRRKFPRTRVIVMSGGGSTLRTDFGSLALELGAVKFLKKPFQPQELIDAVRGSDRPSAQ
jgi:DNA-binding response OmpR family regulator